jgi:hypothetical protein
LPHDTIVVVAAAALIVAFLTQVIAQIALTYIAGRIMPSRIRDSFSSLLAC